MKWILGYGTKFVWNSVTSTLRAPSKRREAVSEEMTCQTHETIVRRAVWSGLRHLKKGDKSRGADNGRDQADRSPVRQAC